MTVRQREDLFRATWDGDLSRDICEIMIEQQIFELFSCGVEKSAETQTSDRLVSSLVRAPKS